MRRLLPVLLLLCVWLVSAIPAAADATVGLPADPATGLCIPFGCAYQGEYQQVYMSSAFSAPITITDLEFFDTANVGHLSETAMNSGIWTISLSTTTTAYNTLSTTYSLNIGSGNTQVFSGNLSQLWAFGDTLRITLSTPFTYDPSKGNLLMDVVASNTSDAGGEIFFNDHFGGNIMGAVYYTAGADRVSENLGLVTGFSTSTAVPEPLTMTLLGLGLAGIVGIGRKVND